LVERKASDSKGFQKLIVWHKAHSLVLLVYKLSDGFPRKELFGLTNQMRRAVVSVPANIAEGYASGGESQFKRFLNVAQGSLAEVEYFLILTHDLKYISLEEFQEAESLRKEVGYLLYRLIASLGKNS
jgi:four helix bundle protein